MSGEVEDWNLESLTIGFCISCLLPLKDFPIFCQPVDEGLDVLFQPDEEDAGEG